MPEQTTGDEHGLGNEKRGSGVDGPTPRGGAERWWTILICPNCDGVSDGPVQHPRTCECQPEPTYSTIEVIPAAPIGEGREPEINVSLTREEAKALVRGDHDAECATSDGEEYQCDCALATVLIKVWDALPSTTPPSEERDG